MVEAVTLRRAGVILKRPMDWRNLAVFTACRPQASRPQSVVPAFAGIVSEPRTTGAVKKTASRRRNRPRHQLQSQCFIGGAFNQPSFSSGLFTALRSLI